MSAGDAACREFLEEVSRPDRGNLGHVPVRHCLRSLRPVLVALRRLTTEVKPPSKSSLTTQNHVHPIISAAARNSA